jgi:K+/H+ antiporter YhaU regulatory subunit KhtT
LSDRVCPPLYLQIAVDIALRIARGELKENSKIYGRSVMSSEYGVSPETIRRSLKLLSDMKVVEIHEKSGVYILSQENARTYVERFGERMSAHNLQQELKKIMQEQSELQKQTLDIIASIVTQNENFSRSNPFPNYECVIKDDSQVIGRSMAELRFWQTTTATIIALRREGNIILSPGPYVQFQKGDIIVYVGDRAAVNAVENFVNS